MKTISDLSLRYILKNKRKFLVIIISIILSTTLLTGVSLGASTIRGYNVESAIKEKGTHHIVFKNLDYNTYNNLKNDNQITNIILLQEQKQISNIEYINQENNFPLTIKSFNENFSDYITLKKGRHPNNNKEIIVSEKLIQETNYKINSYIDEFKIVGIYSDNKLEIEEYTTNHTTIKREFHPVALTKDKINENLTTSYFVTFKKTFNMYDRIYKKASELEYSYTIDSYGNREYSNLEENHALLNALGYYSNIKYQIGSYAYILLILLVISMFCIMTIKNSFYISLSERKKYFGSLRSIGTSKKQIISIVLLETLIISLISIPIGILLGFTFTNIVIYVVNNIMKNFITTNYKIIIYPIYLILSFIFIIITILLSSLTPAKKASSISPLELIKETNSYSVKKSKENYPLIKKIFGTTGELAYKTIKRNNSKFSIQVNALIISMLLFITLSGFTNFLLKNNEYSSNDDSDITLHIEDLKGEEDVIDKIKNIKEIDNIEIKKELHLHFKLDKLTLTENIKNQEKDNNYPNITILGIDNDDYQKLTNNLNIKEGEIILYNFYTYFENDIQKETNYFNNNLNEIKLCRIDNSILKGCNYTFENIYLLNDKIIKKDYYSPTIIMSLEEINEFISSYIDIYESSWIISSSKNINIKINAKDYHTVDKKLNNIFDEYLHLNLEQGYHNNPLRNEETYTNISTIRFIINSAMLFIVIISITSIINTMSTNLSLRETEFSVLRSIGMPKKGLNKMLKLESIFLGLKAIVIGLPSATFFVLLEEYLSYIISKETFPYPYLSYIISIITVFIIVFIMNIYSSNKLKNKNIIDSIRKQSI